MCLHLPSKMDNQHDTFDLRFASGSTHLIVAPSGGGKTYRTAEIIRNKNILFRGGENVRNVIFCYAAWQPIYSQLKQEGSVTKWVNKMPSNQEFVQLTEPFKDKGGSLVILDDFMGAISQNLVEIVTVTARHLNATTLILFQSLFPSNPLARQISLNVKYIHVGKNPRENAQILYLARQLNPSNYKWIVEAYHEATKKPYSSFLFDLMQETDERLRFRSNYLPSEKPMVAWQPKSSSSPIL